MNPGGYGAIEEEPWSLPPAKRQPLPNQNEACAMVEDDRGVRKVRRKPRATPRRPSAMDKMDSMFMATTAKTSTGGMNDDISAQMA